MNLSNRVTESFKEKFVVSLFVRDDVYDRQSVSDICESAHVSMTGLLVVKSALGLVRHKCDTEMEPILCMLFSDGI